MYINDYSRVKPENIIKLKHYMYMRLSIYQTEYYKTTFLALSRLSYNRPLVGKIAHYIRNRNKPIIITELQ